MTQPFIPNAADAFHQDQAEPDSVDFDLLAQGLSADGVLSGCVVTEDAPASLAVAVAAGRVLIDGAIVDVSAADSAAMTADGTHPRFYLIEIDTAGTIHLNAGVAAANPVYPDPTGSRVVLAAVYIPAGDTAITNAQIADKRLILVPLTARTTFDDSDYTCDPTDSIVVQDGTLTAPRTVNLAAASSVRKGRRVTIFDESGSLTRTNKVTVARAGADEIADTQQSVTTRTSFDLMEPFAAIILESNGVDRWTVVAGRTHLAQFLFYRSNADFLPMAVPDNSWAPVPFPVAAADAYGLHPGSTATTTIHADSNGDSLPQNTIYVADASGLDDSGHIVISGPPGAGVETVVGYTGKSIGTGPTGSDELTGANTGADAGISTGTLATGQTVRQADVEWGPTFMPFLWNVIANIGWDTNPKGYCRAQRFRTIDGLFNFPVTTNNVAPLKGPVITAVVAGGAAGDHTVTGISADAELASVLHFSAGVPADLTSEFTVTAADTINNAGGTDTTGDHLVILYYNPITSMSVHQSQVIMQPAAGPGFRNRIEVHHDAGEPVNIIISGIEAPILMGAFMAHQQ